MKTMIENFFSVPMLLATFLIGVIFMGDFFQTIPKYDWRESSWSSLTWGIVGIGVPILFIYGGFSDGSIVIVVTDFFKVVGMIIAFFLIIKILIKIISLICIVIGKTIKFVKNF